MSIVQAMPPIHAAYTIDKFGYNGDVDGAEDLIASGGNAYFPSAAVAAANIDIASSDGNDTADGTGARELTVIGLDENYMLQSEDIPLNGTSDVHPVNDYIAIDRAFVKTAGTGLTNAGNIVIDDGTGTFLTILAGAGQSEKAAYTVPADYPFGYICRWAVEMNRATTATATAALMVRPYGGAWRYFRRFSLSNADPGLDVRPVFPLKIPNKSDVKLRILTVSASNLIFTGAFELMMGH